RVERAELLVVVRVVEAEHRHEMLDGREPFDRPPRHALGRRIGGDEIGIFGFEAFEVVQQRVERLVGNLGRVVDVIPLFVVANRLTELTQTLFGRHGHNRPPVGTKTRKHETTKKTNDLFSVRVSRSRAYPESGQSGSVLLGAPSSSPATSANVRYARWLNSTTRTSVSVVALAAWSRTALIMM